MPKIPFTESQKLDILDCLPETADRASYWDDLEYHSWLSPVWGKMRVGKKKPFAEDVSNRIDALEKATGSLETSLKDLARAHLEDGYAPFPIKEAMAEIETIQGAIYSLSHLHAMNTPYMFADGREKKMEKTLVEVVLALWCRHFPDDPLPADPRQGRLSGGHEGCRPLRCCEIALEAATGRTPKDARRLYMSVMKGWETTGIPLYFPRATCELWDERVKRAIHSLRDASPSSE